MEREAHALPAAKKRTKENVKRMAQYNSCLRPSLLPMQAALSFTGNENSQSIFLPKLAA
jgi:hypothetical protein